MKIEDLGLSKNDLVKLIVDKIFEEFYIDSQRHYEETINKEIRERIDKTIEDIGEKEIFPKVKEKIENICIEQTNNFGEKKGEPLTFIEYITKRAEEYMLEPVDRTGKSIDKGSYAYNKDAHTRLMWLVSNSLSYSIECAVKDMLKDANKTIAKSIQETVTQTLKEVSQKIKI